MGRPRKIVKEIVKPTHKIGDLVTFEFLGSTKTGKIVSGPYISENVWYYDVDAQNVVNGSGELRTIHYSNVAAHGGSDIANLID
jgi:hypothetical protein